MSYSHTGFKYQAHRLYATILITQFLINWPTVKTNLMKYMQKLELNLFVRWKNCSASGGSTYRCHFWGFEPPKQVTKCSSSGLHWQLPSLTLTPLAWPVQCKIRNEALRILQVWQPSSTANMQDARKPVQSLMSSWQHGHISRAKAFNKSDESVRQLQHK